MTSAEMTNYYYIPVNTVTIDSSQWHKVFCKGFNIQAWLRKNKDGLVGGFQVDLNAIIFQRKADVMFFKLSTSL